MAKVINNKTKESIEVKDGEKIRNAVEELGVPFCCTNGICGTCMIDVVEGEENLSELTQQEIDMERDRTHRLGCQCQISKGDIKIEF